MSLVMRKPLFGIVLGAAAGIIDLIPMIAQNLSWDAMLSSFLFWVVTGFLIAITYVPVKGPAKGLLIAFLLASPAAVLIAAKNPFDLLPITGTVVVLGSLLGYLIERRGY
ncbi:MAG: hypothetical protein WC717_06425 [Candidatus Micrarchaeia archaeon]|jgi:hypothetical protein